MVIITVARDGSGDYNCDGVDDQIEINQAIGALPAEGGTVYTKGGLPYNITSSIIVGVNNTTLTGDGESTIIQTSNNVSMISAYHLSGIVIENLYLYGAGAGNASNNGIYFNSVTDSRIEGCWIENAGNNGIYLFSSGTDNNIIINNNIESNKKNGIGLYLADNNMISSNNLQLNTRNGISFSASDSNTITENNCQLNTDHGINLSGSTNNTIYSNNCQSNTDIGIQLLASSNNNTIIGNNFQLNGDEGIMLDGTAGSNNNNTITENNIEGNTMHGIWIYIGSNNVISGNVLKDNDRNNTKNYDGIFVTSNSDNNEIAFNTFIENDRYESNISGSDCDVNIIHDNIFRGTDHEGTINDTGTGTIIYDNIVEGEGFSEILNISAPQQASEGETISISADILNSGSDDTIWTAIADYDTGGLAGPREETFLTSGSQHTFSWTLTMPDRNWNLRLDTGHVED